MPQIALLMQLPQAAQMSGRAQSHDIFRFAAWESLSQWQRCVQLLHERQALHMSASCCMSRMVMYLRPCLRGHEYLG